MFKLLILIAVGFIIYKMFFNKSIPNQPKTDEDENDLVECKNCHTFVPKSECKWTNDGCLCKDCQ